MKCRTESEPPAKPSLRECAGARLKAEAGAAAGIAAHRAGGAGREEAPRARPPPAITAASLPAAEQGLVSVSLA